MEGGAGIRKKEFKFSGLGFILGAFYFFLSASLLHIYWLGNPFESLLSVLVIIYLGVCTWAYSYIFKEMERFDSEIEKLGYTIFKGLTVVLYLVAPMIYIYLKYFDVEESVAEEQKKQSQKLEFSRLGFIIASFYFFFSFIIIHTAWIGNSFESLLSYTAAIYLSVCTWAFSYIHTEIDPIFDTLREKFLGSVLIIFIRPLFYLLAPVIFVYLKL